MSNWIECTHCKKWIGLGEKYYVLSIYFHYGYCTQECLDKYIAKWTKINTNGKVEDKN